MPAVRSMKCISRPPSKFPRTLASLGRMISVISECVLATVRAGGVVSVEFVGLMVGLLHSLLRRSDSPATGYNRAGGRQPEEAPEFQFRQSPPNTQISPARDRRAFEKNG